MTVFCSHWLTITAILSAWCWAMLCTSRNLELRTHCISIGSDDGVKGFNPSTWLQLWCCKDLYVPAWVFQTITDRPKQVVQSNVSMVSPDVIHMRAGLPRAHLWKAQTISYVCQFCYAMANPRQWTVGPLEDFGPSGDPHEVGLFVQTFSAVPSWRSFCCAHPVPPCTKEQKLLLPSSLGIFSVPLNL